MKYLLRYNLFLEDKKEDNFPAEEYIKNFGVHPAKDEGDASKKLSDFNNDIQKYNALKSKIDDIYLRSKDDAEIKSKLLNLMGKRDDVRRNPFLIKYQNIASMKRKINSLKEDITKDQMSQKDYESMSQGNENDTQNSQIADRVAELDNSIKDKNEQLRKLNDQLNRGYSELKKFIEDMKKDMNKWMKTVQNT